MHLDKQNSALHQQKLHNFNALHTEWYLYNSSCSTQEGTDFNGLFVSEKCHASLFQRWQGTDEFAVRQQCLVDYWAWHCRWDGFRKFLAVPVPFFLLVGMLLIRTTDEDAFFNFLWNPQNIIRPFSMGHIVKKAHKEERNCNLRDSYKYPCFFLEGWPTESDVLLQVSSNLSSNGSFCTRQYKSRQLKKWLSNILLVKLKRLLIIIRYLVLQQCLISMHQPFST